MIAIDRLRIGGFRSIQSLEVPLGNSTVFIGSNNCGKTSVLKALQLALSDEYVPIREDFHRGCDGQVVEEIYIDVRFVPSNDKGERIDYFDSIWTKALPFSVQSDRHHKEYFAFRTCFTWDKETASVKKQRFLFSNWDRRELGSELSQPLPFIKLVVLEVEDDLRSALARPHSFINTALEQLREDIEAHPQYARVPIEDFRGLLNRLSETFLGPGSTLPNDVILSAATIGGFFNWVKTHDDTKLLTTRQGQGSQKTLLTLSTITLMEGLARQATAHRWPLFMLMAAEEPESHLHPNAQRTLMSQMMTLSHQLLVTTHSPYVASVVEPQDFRSMMRRGDKIDVRWLPRKMDLCDIRMLKRLILRFRGEVLFARGLMFVEGVTEEQLTRGMFHAYFGDDPSAFGITIVGVDGKSYAPFFLLAMSLRKPFCVVSDNDGDTAHVVLKQLADVEKKVQFDHHDNRSQVFFLSHGLAMEGELVHKLDIRQELIESLMACSNMTDPSPKNRRLRRQRYSKLTDRELKHRLEKKKSEYSGFLGDIIQDNPFARPIEELLPQAVQEAFRLMQTWIGDQSECPGSSRTR